jgi:hypothetical protein
VTWSVSREDPDSILEVTAAASRPEDLDAIAQLFAADRRREVPAQPLPQKTGGPTR